MIEITEEQKEEFNELLKSFGMNEKDIEEYYKKIKELNKIEELNKKQMELMKHQEKIRKELNLPSPWDVDLDMKQLFVKYKIECAYCKNEDLNQIKFLDTFCSGYSNFDNYECENCGLSFSICFEPVNETN